MLKLKYLFYNLDLAEMVLKKWDFAADNLDEPLSHFRTSANAIYTFVCNGQRYFLRIAPAEEKLRNNILGELEFIKYLRSNNYPALNPVVSGDGNTLETVVTPWGTYYAVLFENAAGIRMDMTDFNDTLMYKYGNMLGQLHLLSSNYKPQIRKWSHVEVLEQIRKILAGQKNQDIAFKELKEVERQLSLLPKSNELYGLVHYDFEPDNIFFDSTGGNFTVIDFDDGMYNWYGLDIEQALDSIADELQESRYEQAKEQFLAGYRSVFSLPENVIKSFHLFRRFINLYSYARLLRSVQESWDNEPEWLADLRAKLAGALAIKLNSFTVNIK